MQPTPHPSLSAFVQAFNEVFLPRWNTTLEGGFPEPLYEPATAYRPARIQFTRDYINSALHEVAHWCIAGEERRKQVDYGYWYRPDGRDALEQAEFFRSEIKPQALELAFSRLLGLEFHVSCDNLSGASGGEKEFEDAVHQQLTLYEVEGFPPRATETIRMLGLFPHSFVVVVVGSTRRA